MPLGRETLERRRGALDVGDLDRGHAAAVSGSAEDRGLAQLAVVAGGDDPEREGDLLERLLAPHEGAEEADRERARRVEQEELHRVAEEGVLVDRDVGAAGLVAIERLPQRRDAEEGRVSAGARAPERSRDCGGERGIRSPRCAAPARPSTKATSESAASGEEGSTAADQSRVGLTLFAPASGACATSTSRRAESPRGQGLPIQSADDARARGAIAASMPVTAAAFAGGAPARPRSKTPLFSSASRCTGSRADPRRHVSALRRRRRELDRRESPPGRAR